MARKIVKARSSKAREELPPKRFVFFMLTLLVIWLVVSSMIYVWIQMETIQTGYKLVQAHKKQEVLLDIEKKFKWSGNINILLKALQIWQKNMVFIHLARKREFF